MRDDSRMLPPERKPDIVNEWAEVNAAVWVGTKGGYDMWELWGRFGQNNLEFKLTAHPEHRRAILEARHDVLCWPDKTKRGKRMSIPPVTVLVCWTKGYGLSFKEVEPAAAVAGVGD